MGVLKGNTRSLDPSSCNLQDGGTFVSRYFATTTFPFKTCAYSPEAEISRGLDSLMGVMR